MLKPVPLTLQFLDVVAAFDRVTGLRDHLVTPELDDGPVIAQASYPIESGDGVEDLQRKGHRLEHRMYPQVLCWLSDQDLVIEEGRIFYEQQPLEEPIRFNP